MKYLGLAYFSPEKFAAMAPDEIKELVGQCPALDEKMRATGKVLISASLGDLDKWRTLRPRTGETRITDGPYTESKEVVGGLFIIEADSPSGAQMAARDYADLCQGEIAAVVPVDFPHGCAEDRDEETVREHAKRNGVEISSGKNERPARTAWLCADRVASTWGPARVLIGL